MFGNKRSINVSLAKTPKKQQDSTPGSDNFLRPETVKLITEKTKEVAKVLAITAVAAYVVVKAVDTASQIALKKTKSADKEDD
jgi:hypothetical protein